MRLTWRDPVAKPVCRAPRSRRYRTLVVIASGFTAVSLILRLWNIDNIPGVHEDEGWYGVQGVNLSRGAVETWRTPDGVIADPFYLFPLALLHWFFHPSFTVLRSVAAASGLAALAVNFFLCRRVLGRTTAWLSTAFLAILPINIAYSRLAFEASQSLLVTLPVVYCSLAAARQGRFWRRWLAAGVAAQLVAILVHPSNAFVAPFLVVSALIVAKSRLPSRWWRVFAIGSAVIAAVIAFGLVSKRDPKAREQLVRGEEIAQFAVNLERLFTGDTVYRSISGAMRDYNNAAKTFAVYDMLGSLACAGLILLLGLHALRSRRRREICLVVGLLATLSLFYLAKGADGVEPGKERFAIVLVAPVAIALARAVALRLSPSPQPRVWAISLTVAGLILIGGFVMNYSFASWTPAGEAGFRTGRLEPKEAALRWVFERSPNKFSQWGAVPDSLPESLNRDFRILCAEDWAYFPVKYLSFRYPSVQVSTADLQGFDKDVLQAIARGDAATIIPFNTPHNFWLEILRKMNADHRLRNRFGQLQGRGRATDYANQTILGVSVAQPEQASPDGNR